MWTAKQKKSDLSNKLELSTKACSVNVAFNGQSQIFEDKLLFLWCAIFLFV